MAPRNDAWILRQGKAGQGTMHTLSLGRSSTAPPTGWWPQPAPWAPRSRQACTHGTGRASSRTRRHPPWYTPGRRQPRQSRSTHSPHRCRRSRSRGRRPRRRAWGPPEGEAASAWVSAGCPHGAGLPTGPRNSGPQGLATQGSMGLMGAVQRRLATPGCADLSPRPSGPWGLQLEDRSPRPASLSLPLPGLRAVWVLGGYLSFLQPWKVQRGWGPARGLRRLVTCPKDTEDGAEAGGQVPHGDTAR